ncbi:cytochrome P450 family protein [Ophiobolus disseminans]|uniref:Cytochrome P450 family protein n=1 Tax=Ophiobolus disseminans TaxID=1469910 RepID=A0A6A7AA29_9PLEO|nr:cytochrome P450 family protein [Ophiobolus disseminans]
MSLTIILVWTIFFFFALVITRSIFALRFSPYRHIPGPRVCKITQYWTLWHDVRLRRVQKIHEWHQRYGNVVLIAPGEISFSDIVSTREIYGSTCRLPKSQYFDNFLAYSNRSIFSTLGAKEHQDVVKRTIAFYRPASVFKPTMLQPVRDNVKKTLEQLARRTENSYATLDILVVCNFFAFDNVTRLLYGPELSTQTIEHETCLERTKLAGWIKAELWNNFFYNFPVARKALNFMFSYCKNKPEFLAADKELADWNMRKVDDAARNPADVAVNSLLYLLTTTTTPNGKPLSKSWIAAELLDNIHAAQSTVALALTYTLWNLANYPEWQKRIRAELSAMPLQEDGLPAFGLLQSSPVLDACITESSRLHPLSSGRAERVVPTTRTYDGILIPANTIVSASTLALHHRSDVFPNPQAYNPERWLDAEGDVLCAMQSCHIPFGYGARLCLGKPFAQASIKHFVVGILMQYEVGVDSCSGTTSWSMAQLGTQNALPRDQRCNLLLKSISLPTV